ncbi:conserved hypothetical protein [Pustulibacterium marinum]|uniref:DUF4139 domain-containing protein n=2 Tax=Pustulibacterium marinum TaxID=1224947 RepID=A0A1I7IEQ4_9FLAO|nr:conserved hypothetical protein [Pustulibacterium marinum]
MEVSVIEIDKMSVQPTYEYVAAPVLNENVFLTASIKNWQELNLLPAESNIYFSGVFVGKSYINPYQTEDEMVISLGVAPSISVKRELDSNLKSKNFIGNNRVVETGYILKVSNNSNKTINLKLLDRIPVSQNKEIKVDEVQQDATTYDEKKGILTWNLNLQPNENTEKHLSYEIKFPKGKRINL